ncbi:MAG: hypothetical protein IKS28_01435, partial [Clostridia bacterium]|nr:hypothetical protein [Clostridia bacterium]
MKKSGKLTALLLAAVMLAASLIACVSETPPAVTTGKPVTEGTGGEVTTETSDPGIDKVDFKGRTIRSASCDGWKFILEDSDDPIDSAKYRAACFIEDKYNVKLDSYNGDNSAQLAPMIQESAMTGDYEYDLVFPHATYGVTEMIIQNCLTDWNGLRYVDFDKPWWGRQAIDALAIKDKVFYAYGDITLTSTNFCFEVVNSSLLNDIGYTNNLYQMVFDGNWTTDELIRIASMGTKDLDGDGNFTPDKDQYGFLTNDCFAHRMYAMGSRITELNSEGIPEVVINTPHMQNVVEKFYDLFWSDGTYYSTFTHNTILDTEYFRIMSEGRAVAMDFEIGLFR